MNFDTIGLDEQDIERIEHIIHSDEFAQFLLKRTTELSQALFIIQVLNDKIDEVKEALKN